MCNKTHRNSKQVQTHTLTSIEFRHALSALLNQGLMEHIQNSSKYELVTKTCVLNHEKNSLHNIGLIFKGAEQLQFLFILGRVVGAQNL